MNRKVFLGILLIFVISFISISSGVLAYGEQESITDKDGYNITARTVYGFDKNDVYVIIEDNTDSKKDVNITFEYNDGDKTRLLTHEDAYMKANVTKDVYGLTNTSLGKYKTREEYEVSTNNTTDTKTYVNYTDDTGELLCRGEMINGTENLQTCDYVLDDKSVLVEETGIVGTKEVSDWLDLNATQDSQKISTSGKIEFKNGYLPLGKVKESDKVELRLKVDHPLFTRDFSVPEDQNKYNITVESADGVYKTTLDPTWWNSSYNYKRDTLNTTDDNLLLPFQESDIDNDGNNETFYGQNGSLYYNNDTDWAFANDTTQRCGFETQNMISECPTPPNDLVSYWTLDGTGAVAEDLVGGKDGSLSGGVTQGASGQVNSAYDFDGSDDYVDIPDDPSFDMGDTYTVSLWFKSDITIEDPLSNDIDLIHMDEKGIDGWFLFFEDPVTGTQGGIRFGTNNGNIVSNKKIWNSGQWYHLVVVQNGASSAELYVDGSLDNSGDNGFAGQSTNPLIEIGAITSSTSSNFDGTIDDVRIYDRALSSTEIQNLYDSTDPTAAYLGTEQTENSAPNKPTLNAPTNDSTIADSSPILNVTVSDPDGDATNNTFYWSNGTQIGQDLNVANGSFATYEVTGLDVGTYSWYVNSTDGTETTTSDTWTFSVDTPVLNEFYNQIPADLTSDNLFDYNNILNITYNITDDLDLNISTIKLYHKTNSSTSDVNYYLNGSAVTGFIERDYDSSNGDIYEWDVPEWKIYPITHNLDKDYLTDTTHNAYTINNNEKGYIKTRLYNVTTSVNDTYNYLEIMANASSGIGSLGVWYCNNSYVGGVEPGKSAYCTNFYYIPYDKPYDYTENKSQYHIVPFGYNVTTNEINNIEVTETSYFLLQGAKDTTWNIWTVPQITRTDQVQTSTDGKAYTNYAGTTDLNLRLFDGYRYRYYACANDTSGNQNCTDLRTETFEKEPLPPLGIDFNSPVGFGPTNGNYSGIVDINYTESIDADGTITNYNISLVYPNETLYQHIHDNDLNLTYQWNSTTVPDGNYKVRVTITDNDSLTTDSYSDEITIDNTVPKIEYIDPTPLNGSVLEVDYVTINTSISEENIDNCTIQFDGTNYTGNLNNNYCSITLTSLSDDTYNFKAYISDVAGNNNETELRTIRLRKPAAGPGGIVEPDIVGYFDSKLFTVSQLQTYEREIKFTSNLGPSNSQTVVVSKVEGEACQYIKLQKDLGSDEYGDKGTYSFIKEEDYINVKIDTPSKEIFDGQELKCELKARSNAGTINNFNINIQLKPQIWIRVDGWISDILDRDFKLFSKEICFDQRVLSGEEFVCPEEKRIEFGWIVVALLFIIIILRILL